MYISASNVHIVCDVGTYIYDKQTILWIETYIILLYGKFAFKWKVYCLLFSVYIV